MLEEDFDSVSSDTIPDDILRALNFHFSRLVYFAKKRLRFVDVTNNLDLMIEPKDNAQPIMDSKDEKMRKQNNRTAKIKVQLDNLRTSREAPAAGSATLLLSCSGSPTCLSPILACLETLIALSSCLVPAPVLGFLAVLLLFPLLSPTPPHLASIALRTFNKTLSNELLCGSTTFAEPFYLFLPPGLLPNKTDCKRTFDRTFINFRLLAGNHTREEIDQSFAECGCPALVKLNRLWLLKLLDLNPVCIMEAIPLATIIF